MRVFIVTALVFLSSASFAQLKPHLGMTIPSLTAPPLGREVESINGFLAGVSYKFGNKFYVEGGIQYATFGHKFSRTLDEN